MASFKNKKPTTNSINYDLAENDVRKQFVSKIFKVN